MIPPTPPKPSRLSNDGKASDGDLLTCPWCGAMAPFQDGRWLVCSVCDCQWMPRWWAWIAAGLEVPS